MTWQHYLKDTADTLIPRYVELCEDVAMRSEELGSLYADEKRARAQGWRHSESGSVSGREWDAKLAAEGVSTEIVKLQGEIEAVKEERDLIRYILDTHGQSDH